MFRRKISILRIIASSNLRVTLLGIAIGIALLFPPINAARSAPLTVACADHISAPIQIPQL